MGKFFAVLFLIVFAFWAYPHVANAKWVAPTPTPNYYWGNSYDYSSYSYPGYNYVAPFYGSQNAGWFKLDFWNWGRKSNVGVSIGYQPYSYGSYPNYYSSYYNSGYSNYSYYAASACGYVCGGSYSNSGYGTSSYPYDTGYYGYGY